MIFLLPSDSFMCEECGRCSMSWPHRDYQIPVCPDCGNEGEPVHVVISHVDGREDPLPNEDA